MVMKKTVAADWHCFYFNPYTTPVIIILYSFERNSYRCVCFRNDVRHFSFNVGDFENNFNTSTRHEWKKITRTTAILCEAGRLECSTNKLCEFHHKCVCVFYNLTLVVKPDRRNYCFWTVVYLSKRLQQGGGSGGGGDGDGCNQISRRKNDASYATTIEDDFNGRKSRLFRSRWSVNITYTKNPVCIRISDDLPPA